MAILPEIVVAREETQEIVIAREWALVFRQKTGICSRAMAKTGPKIAIARECIKVLNTYDREV